MEGSFTLPAVFKKISNYTAGDDDYFIMCNNDSEDGLIYITLPDAGDSGAGRIYVVKRLDYDVRVKPSSGDYIDAIDSSSYLPLSAQYFSYMFMSEGVDHWWIVAKNT